MKKHARPMRKSAVSIKNTSRFSDALVRTLTDFARDGRETGPVALNIKNSKHAFRGRAYQQIPWTSPWYGSNVAHLAIVAIGKPEKFPLRNQQYPGLKTAPVYDINDDVEALVVVIAHELQHCEQFNMGRPRSEIEAERVAVKTLERFRAQRETMSLDEQPKKQPKPKPPKSDVVLPPLVAMLQPVKTDGEWEVDAPPGFVFGDTQTHFLCVYVDGKCHIDEVRLAAVDQGGDLVPCADEDCEQCCGDDQFEIAV